MTIRQETAKDHNEVERLIQKAFQSAEHSDGNEHSLVAALRKGESFIPELSLIAESNGTIIGHIMFTKAKVGNDIVLVLAPLSVHPNYQRQGVGASLIKAGHKIAAELGYPYSLVIGSDSYYPRFGYLPAKEFGIEVPKGIPSANFMGIQLQENTKPISGAVTYAKEFGME